MKRFYFLVGVLLIITGCANPEYFFKNDKFLKSEQSRIKQIVVLPFSGETTFRNEVADVFTMHLLNGLKDKEIKIIQPSNAKIVMEEMKISLTLNGDAQFDKETQRLAQLLHADAVIMGEVRSHQTGATMNGFVTVKLIDTKTGGMIAASHRASGLLFGYSVHQAVIAAAENATDDIVSAINELPR